MLDPRPSSLAPKERNRRWRLMLGSKADAGDGAGLDDTRDQGMDTTLDALYDSDKEGGLGSSSPNINRWLGDIRTYFPRSVVQIMQKDALEQLDLNRMLLEPELLESIEADAELVGTLLSLSKVLPDRTKESARLVIQKVVAELENRFGYPLRAAIRGSLQRASRTRRPLPKDIDWQATIRANLRHYQKDYKSIIPEKWLGHERKRNRMQEIFMLIDQSGSMASSVVYSGIFSCIMASISSLRTHVFAFDTAVVDLSEHLEDPVDLLFATRLGGGTDINQAVAFAEKRIARPEDSILFLITDLFEGGNQQDLLTRIAQLKNAGVRIIVLLALSDSGAPAYDHELAAQLAQMQIHAFACTPDRFPDVMAKALE